eukprot:PITA_30160
MLVKRGGVWNGGWQGYQRGRNGGWGGWGFHHRIAMVGLLVIFVVMPSVFLAARFRYSASTSATANTEESGNLNLNIVGRNDLSSSWVLAKPSKVNQRDITNSEEVKYDIGKGASLFLMVYIKQRQTSSGDSSEKLHLQQDGVIFNEEGEENPDGAIKLSKEVDSVVLGKYSIGRRENENENFDSTVRLIRDQLIMDRVYSSISEARNNLDLYHELMLHIKECQRTLGEANADSDLPQSAPEKIKAMGDVLSKAREIFYDCATVTKKLRAMLQSVDDQVIYLCLQESQKHVFHIITDKLNFGATKMWFLLNPPRKAVIHVENVDDFKWLNSSYCPVLCQLESAAMKEYYFKAYYPTTLSAGSSNLKYRNPKYLSMLNHLHFYLPQVYPKLNKILFWDDDIVVQKDLTALWLVDLHGKVNGSVETCGEIFHRFDKYLNFSNPHIARHFDPNACVWAYGMNVFDLKEWKKQDITGIYHKWKNMVSV